MEKQGLVSFRDCQYSLTELVRGIITYLSDQNKTSRRDVQREEKLPKSYDFIKLYKQGLSYQQIADKYGISRDRIRQILSINPEFEAYRQKQKEKKLSLND
ncbi:MAG: helix-turn-helix domain containing protein [Burkholderiales bacterium]|nr:helix-turn-helix domain containing protein [Burkholderiales bacterium]